MKTFLSVMVAIGLGIFSVVNVQAGPAPAKAKSPAPASPAVSAGDWQKKWGDAVAAAKKEGELFRKQILPARTEAAFGRSVAALVQLDEEIHQFSEIEDRRLTLVLRRGVLFAVA